VTNTSGGAPPECSTHQASMTGGFGPVATTVVEARGGIFDQDQADTLLDHDSGHWWFQAKATIVAGLLRQHLPPVRRGDVLVDLGAGAGGVTARLGWPPELAVAVEGNRPLARRARSQHRLQAVAAFGEHVPLADGRAAAVTLLDVIEHLERPGHTLAEAYRVLRPEGVLIVTVPAHGWLWSGADELLGHVKRYTRPMARREVAEAGFDVRSCSHVFSWLVPPMWLLRRLSSEQDEQLGLGASSPLIDRTAAVLTLAEQWVCRHLSLPIGSSIALVAVKPPAWAPPGGQA